MAQITLNSSGVASSGSLLLQTNGTTTQATVDTSGNLGLGVTPSAWGSGIWNAFDIGAGALVGGKGSASNGTVLWYNGLYNGTNTVYKYNGTFASLELGSAGFLWKLAGSGTAGGTVTTTQAMTLDASGNLGVNVTSPSHKIDVSGNIQVRAGNNLYLVNSSGSAYVGLNSPADSVLAFYRGSTESARIDDSGNLLVGTTTTVDSGCSFKNASATAFYRTWSGSGSAGVFSWFSDVGSTAALKGYGRADGGIANYSANNVNLSDQRTKTDIQNAGNYLSKICAIPVRTFKYKDQDDDKLNLGCIAQEVEAIAPELVDNEGFGETPEDGVPLKAIYQTDLQYALMKCIQEQQAIITQLQADVAALKGQA